MKTAASSVIKTTGQKTGVESTISRPEGWFSKGEIVLQCLAPNSFKVARIVEMRGKHPQIIVLCLREDGNICDAEMCASWCNVRFVTMNNSSCLLNLKDLESVLRGEQKCLPVNAMQAEILIRLIATSAKRQKSD